MADPTITFDPGSSRSDRDAEIFTFDAVDAGGRVRCAISYEAFEALTGTIHLDPASANVMFVNWEDDIFALARAKYDRGERQPDGSVVVRASDIASL